MISIDVLCLYWGSKNPTLRGPGTLFFSRLFHYFSVDHQPATSAITVFCFFFPPTRHSKIFITMAVVDTPSGYESDEGTDNFPDDRRTASASAFDDEEDEDEVEDEEEDYDGDENDYEEDEDESTAAPPKKSIKFVVANPAKNSAAAAKPASKKRTTRQPRYTEPDEDDEDEIVEEDAFQEEEDEEGTNDNDNEDAESEEDDEETPDFTKMTARQRARKFDIDDGPLLELPATKKKAQLTEEEQQLRREELARRRKNMSVRRLEEEKQETLDKLLKKRASRSRKAIVDDTGNDTDAGSNTPVMGEDGRYRVTKSRLVPRHPSLLAWQSNRLGFSLSFEKEWVDLKSGNASSSPGS